MRPEIAYVTLPEDLRTRVRVAVAGTLAGLMASLKVTEKVSTVASMRPFLFATAADETAGVDVSYVKVDEATVAPILKREDGLIDWKLTAREIDDRRRGFTPFPGCYTILHGLRLEIVECLATIDSSEETGESEIGRAHV